MQKGIANPMDAEEFLWYWLEADGFADLMKIKLKIR